MKILQPSNRVRNSAFGIQNSALAAAHRQRGIALVITLIMLAVTLVMAVAFLALAKRERGSVTTSTDTTTSRLAADSAVANANGQIVASILSGFNGLDSGNAYNFHLLVSTNYINPAGFNDTLGYVNATNVNYDYLLNGGSLSDADRNQNIENLFFLPRPPVYIPKNPSGYDFRYYLDLNENGSFDTNYFGVDLDSSGNPLPGQPYLHTGDPEWVGVLEHPDQPHGPNNHFTSRYAFAAIPIGNALDVNYIHNQTRSANLSQANDGYFRNEGVGSWELNLAAFLADLNTNEWDNPLGPYPYKYLQPTGPNTGYAFADAQAILSYRYGGNYNSLAIPPPYFYDGLTLDGIDGYTYGNLMTSTVLPPVAAPQDQAWAGSDNTNHFFSISDLMDGSKTGTGGNTFTGRLGDAATKTATYDRYTFYRMLDQLGTDSSSDDGKLNLNYSNAVVTYKNFGPVSIPVSVAIITGAETNMIPWRPQDFFITAADQMLRLYTKEWYQSSPSNYLATYYGYVPPNYIDATGYGLTNFLNSGVTNQIPSFGITNIPVMVNSNFVYSPAVNRLLQLAANLYDASTNLNNGVANNLPHVFRPIFERDINNNIFIVGYTNVQSVLPQGTGDAQLEAPRPISDLLLFTGGGNGGVNTPIYDAGGLVNVYGVPWIIGAKKGLPNFNQFYMITAAQVTRKMEVTRSSLDPATAVYGTNQYYTIGISNSLGGSFWNSYSNDYPRSLTVYVYDRSDMYVTNMTQSVRLSSSVPLSTNYTIPKWPGSKWTGTAPNITPQSTSFLPFDWTYVFQYPVVYNMYSSPHAFDPLAQWPQPNSPSPLPLAQLDQFGIAVTNYLQAYIVDGNNVIDYVELASPITAGGINQALADPDYPSPPNNAHTLWSTNYYPSAPPTPYGAINQIDVSKVPGDVPSQYSGTWASTPTPEGLTTSAAEAAFFGGFFTPTYRGSNGKVYVNRQLEQQVPFTPVRTVYCSYLLQANDPLVHYLASDLNAQPGATAIWAGRTSRPNGVWGHVNDALSQPSLPVPPSTPKNGRFQPWGASGQMSGLAYVDTNLFNLSYKDPLIMMPDSWDFPTNAYPTVGWIGRVHRGTPWQTVNLKATNILLWAQSTGQGVQNIGTNTWATWTGDSLPLSTLNVDSAYFPFFYDAANSSPLQDRLLFDIFTTRFNDNSARGTLPVNQTGLAAWSAVFSGMQALANNAVVDRGGQFFSSYSNLLINPAGPSTTSPLNFIVNNINAVRANQKNYFPYVSAFTHVGDILQAPALSESSPFLGKSSQFDTKYGISDEVYEWIPQQMMGLVRQSTPRFVLYCWGQTLRPAPGGTVLGGPYFQLVTNYQVTAETAVRAVVRIDGASTGSPHAVVESYNVLPPY